MSALLLLHYDAPHDSRHVLRLWIMYELKPLRQRVGYILWRWQQIHAVDFERADSKVEELRLRCDLTSRDIDEI